MTSLNKIKANRFNARASTGPRSTCGRTRASQNARRHGLSVSLSGDPVLSRQVELLAREISGGRRVVDGRSIRVAEAQIDLVRVRAAKQTVSQQLNEIWAVDSENADVGSGNSEAKLSDINRLMKQLLRIDRYERRALSRRRKAIRSYRLADDEITIDLSFNLAERSQNDQ
jgi:hypothetical protein